MKVKSESEVAQLCPTPSDPEDCSLPGSSIHGIFQARVLEWGAIAWIQKSEGFLFNNSILFTSPLEFTILDFYTPSLGFYVGLNLLWCTFF